MKMTTKNMLTVLIFVMVVLIYPQSANATFSIIAVDTVTGAIGSAGCTCGYGIIGLSKIIEEIGAIHCQSYYNPVNEANALEMMSEGLTPDSILTWLYYNDADANPNIRQYLAVTLAGPGNSDTYSGYNNPYYQNEVSGPGYAIAGNQLIDPAIITNMETAFLTTPGEIEDRIMAALQQANIPGADRECLSANIPGKSAFIRVIKPGDGDSPYLEKNVHAVYGIGNPIDSLQVLFDLWKAEGYADADESSVTISDEYLDANCSDTATITMVPVNNLGQTPGNGIDSIIISNSGTALISDIVDNGNGSFEAKIYEPESANIETITVNVFGEEYNTEITDKPVIEFYANGDANSDMAINILDIVFQIAYLYKNGTASVPPERADTNASGNIDILDITYLIAFLYKNGPTPKCL